MQWQVSTMDRTLTDGDLSDVVTTLHWQVTDSETVGDATRSRTTTGE